ncbi:hypothetical protein L0B53_18910 (plasmid) [Vibrio sp. SS-MA-C1-2]|uniref:hypothetical protein n=1 Tax=Vibrio sp. SS-MA-C1-2 TaxID=2908646 RepID=UPI001F243CDB|nr:hypothetical protein [Vibrio sp. SS-MA-C1-2]UJF20207.1 hypothetical protein L0B53_18910 [Vibrio sp. SS-MA-C1-2]
MSLDNLTQLGRTLIASAQNHNISTNFSDSFDEERFFALAHSNVKNVLSSNGCPLKLIPVSYRGCSPIKSFILACQRFNFKEYLSLYEEQYKTKLTNENTMVHNHAFAILFEIHTLAKTEPLQVKTFLACTDADVAAIAELPLERWTGCLAHGYIPFTLSCANDFIDCCEKDNEKNYFNALIKKQVQSLSETLLAA